MRERMLRICLVAAPAVAVLVPSAWAADVNISVGAPGQSAPVVVQPAQPSTVVQPSPAGSAVIVSPGSPQVMVPATPAPMVADTIRAHQVRAQAIYANKIKAREVQGVIHQTGEVKVGSGRDDIKAPMVTASVIYADEIRADSVVGNDIYVRDLSRD